MKRHHLPAEVLRALELTKPTRGWNARASDVLRFELGQCVLLVVPHKRWAYRRRELHAAAYQEYCKRQELE